MRLKFLSLLFIFPFLALAENLIKCDKENEAGFKEFCGNPIHQNKKWPHKIPLWQGTDYPGYQLIDCNEGSIKNVIEKTGETYFCHVHILNKKSKSLATCDPGLEVTFLDFCSKPENNSKIGSHFIPFKQEDIKSGHQLIDCQKGTIKIVDKSGESYSCTVPARSLKIIPKE